MELGYPGRAGLSCVRRIDSERGSRRRILKEMRLSRSRIIQEPYVLDSVRRQVVLKSLNEVCCHHGWALFAAHVRTNHVHVVLAASSKPESIIDCDEGVQ